MPSSTHQPRSPQQAATPTSIPVNRLGLSPQDVATLQQHQQLAHAQQRSPAGSQASSQGRLLLDPGSLQLLSRHFDRIMQAISQRLEQLNRATEIATQSQYDRAGNALQVADAEIARFRAILQQTDDLETELDKIKRIREIVRGFRARVEHMERRLG
ncbi:hypothetical protein B0A55_01572 [Friedmanniomyces simplex]|uniref:Biogenesis of lysosome-related organelles complex 1 subunit CNL1 n=1 Tax=Friedmanniomyces simplex TaxID=329884 RepID=A0A4U0XZK1_9PEZI|nr:hypothetical protein B0A55_01572 [Friedmanniomyces simplex]